MLYNCYAIVTFEVSTLTPSLSWSCHVDPLAFLGKKIIGKESNIKRRGILREKISSIAGKEEEWKVEKLRRSCGREKIWAKATPYAPRRANLLCNFITRSFSYLCLFFLIPPRMPISPTPHYFNYSPKNF